MNRITVFIIACSLIVSCSTYKVTVEINKSSSLKKLKKTGIVIRTGTFSHLKKQQINENITYWLSGLKKNTNGLATINGTGDGLTLYSKEMDSFYQVSQKDKMLTSKTVGVIRQYLKKNESEIKDLLAKNGLDSLIIYEVNGVYSTEMQYIQFLTALVVLDSNLEIAYLDRQKNTYDINELDPGEIVKHLLDEITQRLIEKMDAIGFVKA